MALTGSDSPFISAVIGKPHHCHFSTVGSREIESDKSASDGLGPTVKVLCGSVYYDEWNMSNVSLHKLAMANTAAMPPSLSSRRHYINITVTMAHNSNHE